MSQSSSSSSAHSDVVSPLEFLASSPELARLREGVKEYDYVVKGFNGGVGPGVVEEVLAVHRSTGRGPSSGPRLQDFLAFRRAVAAKNGGDPNVKLAWFGGSKDQVCGVVSGGFCGPSSSPDGGGLEVGHGVGVYLCPAKYPNDCVEFSTPDENEIRHMLLCRVIMGNMEQVPAGSTQSCPSSDKFDSGVDDLIDPRRYVVWCSNMNTHIFPEFVISFRVRASYSSRAGVTRKRKAHSQRRPTSPWVSFDTLFSMLPEYLDPAQMALISRAYDGFRKNKFTRLQLIQKTRQVAGDGLLASIIKSRRHEVKEKKPNRLGAGGADRDQALPINNVVV